MSACIGAGSQGIAHHSRANLEETLAPKRRLRAGSVVSARRWVVEVGVLGSWEPLLARGTSDTITVDFTPVPVGDGLRHLRVRRAWISRGEWPGFPVKHRKVERAGRGRRGNLVVVVLHRGTGCEAGPDHRR